jgi:hypothetical protein
MPLPVDKKQCIVYIWVVRHPNPIYISEIIVVKFSLRSASVGYHEIELRNTRNHFMKPDDIFSNICVYFVKFISLLPNSESEPGTVGLSVKNSTFEPSRVSCRIIHRCWLPVVQFGDTIML